MSRSLGTSSATADDTVALPCRQHDADLWFSAVPAELERAKGLCRACPIRARCLADAVARREYWGVWGGQIVDHGAIVPFKRPAGRPRKVA